MGRAVHVPLLLHGVTDGAGDPLALGKVYFYVAGGTTTDKTVWTDVAKTTPASQPVVLDSAGRAQIYADGEYRVKIETAADVATHDFDPLRFFFPEPSLNADTSMANNVDADGTAGGAEHTYLHQPEPNWPVDKELEAGIEMVGIAGGANTTGASVEVYIDFALGLDTDLGGPSWNYGWQDEFPQTGDILHFVNRGKQYQNPPTLSTACQSPYDFSANVTLGGVGSMTWTSGTVNHAEVIQNYSEGITFVDVTGTVGGSLGLYLEVITGLDGTGYYFGTNPQSQTALIFDGSGVEMGWVWPINGTFWVFKADGTNWTAGAGRRVIFSVSNWTHN